VHDPRCAVRGKCTISCSQCPQGLIVSEVAQTLVEIKPGMQEGDELRFSGLGNEELAREAGDLVVRLRSPPPHKQSDAHSSAPLSRNGNNLHTRMEISLVEALVGFNRSLVHLDGHSVPVARDRVTPPNATIRVPNEGMPLPPEARRRAGELVINIVVKFPEVLTPEQKAGVVSLFAGDQ